MQSREIWRIRKESAATPSGRKVSESRAYATMHSYHICREHSLRHFRRRYGDKA